MGIILKESRCSLVLITGLFLIGALFIGSSSNALAQSATSPIELKFGSVFPPPPQIATIGCDRWQKEVVKRTQGKVKFKNFYMGALFAPGESLNAVQNRFADIIHYCYVYVPGKTPLGNFTVAIPFRPVDPLTNIKIVRTMWDKIPAFDQEMANYNGKVIFLQAIMTYDVLSTMPITTLDEFKGKRLGVISLWFPDYAAASGATPVPSAMLGRYQMIERGVLDGEIITLDLADSFKHYEVIKHFTSVGLGSIVVIAITANMDAWKELPPDVQKAMLEAGRETELWHSQYLNRKREEIMNKWGKDYGIKFHTLPEKQIIEWANKMPDTAAKFAKEVEAKGWPGWKIMDQYIELSEKHGHKWPRKFGVR
jgi:TRAP-type C4-dicarboxylate transport system substrate-binding protein